MLSIYFMCGCIRVFGDVHVGFLICFLPQTFFSPPQPPPFLAPLKPRRFPPLAHLRSIDVKVAVSAAVTVYPSVLMPPMSLIVRRTQEAWRPQSVSPSSFIKL